MGLALRLANAGASVIIGSRDEARALASARSCNQKLGRPIIAGTANREMLRACGIVFLTVPFSAAIEAVESIKADLLPGHILVDVTVPMHFSGGRAEYAEQDGISGAERIAEHLPGGIHLVGAFKTIPAHVLSDLNAQLNCDVFVCGDVPEERVRVMEIVRWIPTLRPLDAGPLRTARTLERMSVLAVNLNRTYKKKGARYQIEGL